jgi:hypothetical protein
MVEFNEATKPWGRKEGEVVREDLNTSGMPAAAGIKPGIRHPHI